MKFKNYVVASCKINKINFRQFDESCNKLKQLIFFSQRKELEERVRSVQEKLAESSADGLDWKEKFETLERDSSPASKEYLKNLVLQYLAVTDKSKKASMQMALMTILELTTDDIK